MFNSASGWRPLAASSRKEFGMSHQDRKSKTRIVVNHESLEQAVNELFTAKTFRQVKARKGSKWTARMLVTVAVFWAWSGCMGLKERFTQAAKLAGKILRWLPDPGRTYHGFLKQLQKWHAKLQIACMSELRVLMKQDLFGQAAEPFVGECPVGNRLVVGGIVERLPVGAARVGSGGPRSVRPEPGGGDQSDPTSDASLSYSARSARRNPLGDVSWCVARRVPKNHIEDGS
jgi:hypothetical protein